MFVGLVTARPRVGLLSGGLGAEAGPQHEREAGEDHERDGDRGGGGGGTEISFTRDTPEVAVMAEPASTLWATSPRTGAMTESRFPAPRRWPRGASARTTSEPGDSLAFAASWERGLLANETQYKSC